MTSMSKRQSPAVAVATAIVLCLAASASAQDAREAPSIPSLTLDALKQTVLDPTTYAPAGLLYVSERLDWNSSQVFFAHGDLENNPRFTITGLPHDAPLSYSAGNKVLLTDAMNVAAVSITNNAVTHFTVDALAIRHPEHRKLWTTLGWIERAAVASSLSYFLSVQHFEQWKENERLAAERGY